MNDVAQSATTLRGLEVKVRDRRRPNSKPFYIHWSRVVSKRGNSISRSRLPDPVTGPCTVHMLLATPLKSRQSERDDRIARRCCFRPIRLPPIPPNTSARGRSRESATEGAQLMCCFSDSVRRFLDRLVPSSAPAFGLQSCSPLSAVSGFLMPDTTQTVLFSRVWPGDVNVNWVLRLLSPLAFNDLYSSTTQQTDTDRQTYRQNTANEYN